MDVSPIDVQKVLGRIDYPANREQLLDCAERNDAPAHVLDALRALPEQDYDGPNAVSSALSDAEVF